MSQVHYYAEKSIVRVLLFPGEAARMLQDLLRSVASIQAGSDSQLPQSPRAATSCNPSCSFSASDDAQIRALLDHTRPQNTFTPLHPVGGIPGEPSYTHHTHPSSFPIPHAAIHPAWPCQQIPPSTVAPLDTLIPKPTLESLLGLPSYHGPSAIDMSPLPMGPHPDSETFATGFGLQTVPPPFERADEMSAQYPHRPSVPSVSPFRFHTTASRLRGGRRAKPTHPSPLSAMQTTFSIAPAVSDPPPKATASPSCAGPRGKTTYLPPTYDKLQGEEVHEFKVVSLDSMIEAARTQPKEKVCTPVDSDWLKTDLMGQITFYDPHHPMSQPIPFGAQLRLFEDSKAKGQPQRYRCRYKDPVVMGDECGDTFKSFSNWQRHFGSTHVKDEHDAINRKALDVSRAVAVKHGKAAIQVIECCSCQWRSQVGDRLDMVWKRHLMSEHGVLQTTKDTNPSVKKGHRAQKDDEQSVKKRRRDESDSDTVPGASGAELEGPPRAKKCRTNKRR